MRRLPFEGLSVDYESEPCGGGNSTDLRCMPHHVGMDAGDVRPFQDGVPAHRRSRERAMRTVPCKRQLQPDDNRVRVMPFKGLSRNDEPKSRTRGNPTTLRGVPHHGGMDAGDV